MERIYCKSVSPEGYICDLYKDHRSELCKDKHEHHSWVKPEDV